MTTNTGALTLERRPAMSDDERRILHEELHDARAVFETLGSSDHPNDHAIIGAPVTLASDLDDGYSAHAAATADGKVCIATVKTPGTDGAVRSVSYLHLEPAVLLMLAALVPPDVLARAATEAGAAVVELPTELARQVDANTVTGQPLGGVLIEQGGRVNGECGEPGCTHRVEQLPGTDTWMHVPDGNVVPTHEPKAPGAAVVPLPEPTLEFVDIVFDAMPEAEGGRFIEAENPDGVSVSVGEWVTRPDGSVALRIPRDFATT